LFVLGPEFAIFSSLTSLRRDNFVNSVIFATVPAATPNRPTGTAIDLSAWEALASDPDQLIAALNELLLHGTMSEAMGHIVKDAVASIPADNRLLRVQTVIYLIATSPQYQVQR